MRCRTLPYVVAKELELKRERQSHKQTGQRYCYRFEFRGYSSRQLRESRSISSRITSGPGDEVEPNFHGKVGTDF